MPRVHRLAIVALLTLPFVVPSGALAYPPPSPVGTAKALTGSGSTSGLTVTSQLYKLFDPALGCAAYELVSTFKWSKLPPNGDDAYGGDYDAFGIDFSLPANYQVRSSSISGTYYYVNPVYGTTQTWAGEFYRVSGGSGLPFFRFNEKSAPPPGYGWMKSATLKFSFNKLSGCKPTAPQWGNITPRYVRTLDSATNWSFSVTASAGPISASLNYSPNTSTKDYELKPSSPYQYSLP